MESFYPNSSRQHQQQQLQQHQRLQQQQLQQQQQQQQQLLQSQHNNPYAQQQQQQGVIPAGPSPLSTSSPHSITYHQQSPMIQTGTGSASYSSTPNNYPVSGGLFGGPSSEQKTRSVGNNSGNMSYGRDSYHSGGGLGYAGIGGMSSYGGNQNNDHPRASSSSAKGGNGAAGQSGNGSQGAAAKRGSKACVACRKGKNRCEMDPNSNSAACKRCLASNTACVFEKITDKARGRNSSIAAPEGLSGDAEGRVSHLERSVNDLARGQNQIQSALQQILNMLPQNSSFPAQNTIPYLQQQDAGVPTANIFNNSVSPPSLFNQSPSSLQAQNQGLNQQNHFIPHQPQLPQSPQNIATGRSNESGGDDRGRNREKKRVGDFPKLPGFAPPNHRFGTYGIIPLSSAPASPAHSRHSSRSSSSHSVASSSALPQDSLTAPIQALQALANAADQAAATRRNNGHDTEDEKTKALDTGMNSAEEGNEDEAAHDKGDGSARKRKRVTIDPKGIHLRVKKKTKPDPTPRNPFPDVVTKGLVDEQEARELWDVFFSGCHYFVPLWDKTYDTYESYIERTPFSTNGLLAVAAKIRAGNGPLGETFHRCLEEAQGIARSTLFGPIVRKEAVMAMLILSVWSQNGWLPCGHALRGGLDMNLHKALDKLNAETPQPRSETEERDLVVSARIWLNCYMHEHLVSLGTAKPLLLRDDASVRHARLLLTHPMASETDMRLVAGVELVNLRVRVVDHLSPLHGKVDAQTISFVRRMFTDLQSWYREWYSIHRTKYDEESVLVKLLEAELVYAQLWTVCVALRGCAWDKLPAEQRELAFQAKDAALRCLEIFLRSPNFRAHLKYATHDQLVSVAFAAVFLLKIAILYPSSIALPSLISQVAELAHLLSSECFAERYALTLRLMLSNFRRKTGALSTMPGTPRLGAVGDDIMHGDVGGLGNGDAFNGDLEGGLQSLLSLPQMDFGENNVAGDWGMEGMEGFSWPTEFSPSNLPVWLQDGNFTDLGLPQDGSDSLFLPPELANMFLPSGTAANGSFNFTLPDSGDVGAEAW